MVAVLRKAKTVERRRGIRIDKHQKYGNHHTNDGIFADGHQLCGLCRTIYQKTDCKTGANFRIVAGFNIALVQTHDFS